jgi:hypothetical protein
MPRGKAHARARLSRTGKPWWRRRSNRRCHLDADRGRGRPPMRSLLSRAAGARTARRRRAAGCRPPKIGPSEQESRRPRSLIANGYLPGVTVGGIRVRCSAAAPACGNARSRCQPICAAAGSLWRGPRPSVVASWELAILADSSEPATITPRATRLTPMMKFLIIVVFYSRSFDAFLH